MVGLLAKTPCQVRVRESSVLGEGTWESSMPRWGAWAMNQFVHISRYRMHWVSWCLIAWNCIICIILPEWLLLWCLPMWLINCYMFIGGVHYNCCVYLCGCNYNVWCVWVCWCDYVLRWCVNLMINYVIKLWWYVDRLYRCISLIPKCV